jgi:hypothetical protein
MPDAGAAPPTAKRLGLCADCKHAHEIVSDKGSIFLQCRLAFTNPAFPKYPALPVLRCSGYEKK